MPNIQTVNISNATDYPIVTTIRVIVNPKGVLLINSGTCIPRGFYDDIAGYFSNQGYITIQYDYVGVGDSRPADLSKVDRSIYDWGAHDMQIMSEWIDANYPLLDKYILAHSMGGQIVGLMPSVNSFKKIITIASSYGNVRNFLDSKRKAGMFIALYSIFPLLNKLYGYFPADLPGMGMDWPYKVAEDWRIWNTKYLSLREWMDRLSLPHHFDELTVSMSSYLLADDEMASYKCISHFLKDYPNTHMQVVEPETYGLTELGHFKTFRRQALPFWKDILSALESE